MNQSRRFILAGALLAATMSVSACGYNTLPTQEEAAKTAWANVQSEYQRRADLVPNLVSTVQGAASQEREVLTAVTEARASATRPQFDASTITDPAKFREFEAAQGQLGAALGRLMAIQESYPELHSLEAFQALQNQLEGTENRITISRRDYNAAVQTYNTSLRTFPSVIWAKTLQSGQQPMQMFTASAGAERAPSVTFK